MTIGENIKRIRQEKGLTQKQLGNLCNPSMADSAIRRYEAGKANPKIETIQKIADALNVSLDEFIPDSYDVSQEHPIAFPGLEKKLSEIGYHIGYGYDYAEYSDDEIWITSPDGEKLFISLSELENLNLETEVYLKFRIEQLKARKK